MPGDDPVLNLGGSGAARAVAALGQSAQASLARARRASPSTVPVATLSYFQAVMADSPRGYWRLGEAAGTFADSSGNGNTATATGAGISRGLAGVTTVDGSIAFDGSGSYISAPDANSLDLGDVLSIEFWHRRSALPSTDETIVSKGANAYKVVIRNITSNARIYLLKENVNFIQASSINFPLDNNWHHVVVTKNGATTKIYTDGVEGSTVVSAQTLADTTSELRSGRDNSNVQFLNGGLDELAVYATELSAARILVHYQLRA